MLKRNIVGNWLFDERCLQMLRVKVHHARCEGLEMGVVGAVREELLKGTRAVVCSFPCSVPSCGVVQCEFRLPK